MILGIHFIWPVSATAHLLLHQLCSMRSQRLPLLLIALSGSTHCTLRRFMGRMVPFCSGCTIATQMPSRLGRSFMVGCHFTWHVTKMQLQVLFGCCWNTIQRRPRYDHVLCDLVLYTFTSFHPHNICFC